MFSVMMSFIVSFVGDSRGPEKDVWVQGLSAQPSPRVDRVRVLEWPLTTGLNVLSGCQDPVGADGSKSRVPHSQDITRWTVISRKYLRIMTRTSQGTVRAVPTRWRGCDGDMSMVRCIG